MRLIVLDRDGVINENRTVLTGDDWVPIDAALEAIRLLTEMGFVVCVFTNQREIATGRLSIAALNEIHAKMAAAVEARGGRISHVEVCPHGPDDGCRCRKPRPGMLENIVGLFQPDELFVVGDKDVDVLAGLSMGAKSFYVETGHRERIDYSLAKSYGDLLEFVRGELCAY